MKYVWTWYKYQIWTSPHQCHTGIISSVDNMNFSQLSSSLLLISSVFLLVSSSPVPGGPLDFLFKDAPLLGPLAGLAGGSLVTAGLGFAGKNSILNTINTISNVANAKLGLLNLGANLVGTGLQGVEQLQGQQHQGGYQGYRPRPRYQSFGY